MHSWYVLILCIFIYNMFLHFYYWRDFLNKEKNITKKHDILTGYSSSAIKHNIFGTVSFLRLSFLYYLWVKLIIPYCFNDWYYIKRLYTYKWPQWNLFSVYIMFFMLSIYNIHYTYIVYVLIVLTSRCIYM